MRPVSHPAAGPFGAALLRPGARPRARAAEGSHPAAAGAFVAAALLRPGTGAGARTGAAATRAVRAEGVAAVGLDLLAAHAPLA
ncbi:MAG: hypothetical protein ABSD82_10955 [Solirubrobacteraceae bacterium]